MVTFNSLSGGKTSSYLATFYPADYNIFALVRIEADYCKPKDEGIVKFVSDKIGMQFIATAESDITLYVVRDIEQKLGKEIKWVTGETFETVIKKKKALPNMMWRFCTTEMKMKPIFEFWLKNFTEPIKMRVGFRHDESERANFENNYFKTVVGKSASGRNKWKEIYWRKNEYPLIENWVDHYKVSEWAKTSGLIFPPDSNCVGCFWKPIQQLRRNFEDEPMKMLWFENMEKEMRRKFKKEMKYSEIRKVGLQDDFFFGTGSGCQAGFCTN